MSYQIHKHTAEIPVLFSLKTSASSFHFYVHPLPHFFYFDYNPSTNTHIICALSISICKNIHQANSAIYATTLSLGYGDLSPCAINQETELCAVCPQELIISSIGKEGLDLITGTK